MWLVPARGCGCERGTLASMDLHMDRTPLELLVSCWCFSTHDLPPATVGSTTVCQGRISSNYVRRFSQRFSCLFPKTETPAFHSGFRVDEVDNAMMSFRWGSTTQALLGVCAIYSQSAINRFGRFGRPSSFLFLQKPAPKGRPHTE